MTVELCWSSKGFWFYQYRASKTTVKGAYTSLGNPYFDKIVKKSRERFGFVCYESSKTVKAIHKDYKNKAKSIYLLISHL